VKKLLLILFCIPLFAIAQQNNLTYRQAHDVTFSKKYKNFAKINSYTTKDGWIIKVGDEMTIGKASIKKEKYKVDDVFSNIVIGNRKGTDLKNFKHLPHRHEGTKVVVRSIFVTHIKQNDYKFWSNRKDSPLYVSIFVKNPKTGLGSGSVVSAILSSSKSTILDIEKALEMGEIINPNAKMSRSEAIAKLKESKDLMDIGLMSEKEYSKLKDELTPIIMNKQ